MAPVTPLIAFEAFGKYKTLHRFELILVHVACEIDSKLDSFTFILPVELFNDSMALKKVFLSLVVLFDGLIALAILGSEIGEFVLGGEVVLGGEAACSKQG